MIKIIYPLGKYKYDTWRILLVKCHIDNSVRLWSCIRNINRHHRFPATEPWAVISGEILRPPPCPAHRPCLPLRTPTTASSRGHQEDTAGAVTASSVHATVPLAWPGWATLAAGPGRWYRSMGRIEPRTVRPFKLLFQMISLIEIISNFENQ
jgi:hypothetical protein